MLSSWGYLPELYASAEEFLSAAATSEAACVVIDTHLGDISGVDLAIRLAAIGFKLPIIFVTESQDEHIRNRVSGRAAPATGHGFWLHRVLAQAISSRSLERSY